MDPITSAIVVALASGVAGGAGEVGKSVIVDAYTALKAALKQKCGVDSKVVKAVDDLEKEPDFKPNQDTLTGRVAQANIVDDSQLQQLAQALMEALKSTPEGQKATGKFQIDVSGGQVGVIGDDAEVKGGIHFGKGKK